MGEDDAGGEMVYEEEAEDEQVEGDGEVAPIDGDHEAEVADAIEEEASSTKAVCCKCGKEASNGATVYSCSTGGSCRKCKKYGGQKAAERIAAPAACASGGRRSHSACKKAFER